MKLPNSSNSTKLVTTYIKQNLHISNTNFRRHSRSLFKNNYVMDSHSVLHHSFADDTQLQKSAPPQQVDELIQSIQQCVHDVKSWMTHNKLKLNGYTTEALIRSAPRISNSVPLLDSLTAGNSTVRFSQSAKYCGVTLDMHLTMTAHVVNPDQNC